jgi:hypothetical protein
VLRIENGTLIFPDVEAAARIFDFDPSYIAPRPLI